MIAANTLASLRAGLQARPAAYADQQQIADLILSESHVHRHLDWRAPLEWLGHSPYWVLEERGRIAAALACPPDPDPIAWIRLFVFASHLSGPLAWSPLWTAARRELAGRGNTVIAAITVQRWFDSILAESGFDLAQHIALLEWNNQPARLVSIPSHIIIRAMRPDDLPRVADIDAAAFQPLWQNSLNALSKACSQAIHASVAENASGVIGYQISTGSSFGAHLARLAVRPDAQGQDVGAALVHDLICHMRERGIIRLSVNTQADNAVSLALYHKFGFHRTGEQYPVYTHRVE